MAAMEKKDKTLNVPNLRFPEFSGEWDGMELQDIAPNICSGRDKPSHNGKVILYGSTGVIGMTESASYWDELILVARVGANAGQLQFANSPCGVTDNALVINAHEWNTYIYYYLQYYNLNRLVFGSGQPLITGGMLKKIKIKSGKNVERLKITHLLSLLDQRIETQKKVIEDLKRLKYAISKRVFAEMGQHHPVVKLGQLCSIKTGKLDANAMIDNGEFPFFTCAREDYRTDTYAFEGDSLLISGNGDIGIVKRYNGKFNAYQRTYVLQDFIQEIAYVQCFVEHHLPKRVLKEKNVGAMPYIVLSTLSEMPIILPPTYIQNAICKTIGAISEQINVEEKILANFELQKQYNLSMMFI